MGTGCFKLAARRGQEGGQVLGVQLRRQPGGSSIPPWVGGPLSFTGGPLRLSSTRCLGPFMIVSLAAARSGGGGPIADRPHLLMRAQIPMRARRCARLRRDRQRTLRQRRRVSFAIPGRPRRALANRRLCRAMQCARSMPPEEPSRQAHTRRATGHAQLAADRAARVAPATTAVKGSKRGIFGSPNT